MAADAKGPEAKDGGWLDANDLKYAVPGDCEKLAMTLWNRMLELHSRSSGVTASGVEMLIQHRLDAKGRPVVCLSRDSFKGFLGALRTAKQKQIEASVANLYRDSDPGFSRGF